MTIDRIKINERLEKLKEYTQLLKQYQSLSFEDFHKDITVRAAVERYFQLAIECLIDICEILISNLGLPKPETTKDVFLIIGKSEVMPHNFANTISGMAGFRNILVHEYIKLDIKKVFDHLQNDLSDFDQFTKHIADYLTKIK